MSETVRYTGKIKLLERMNNETLEEQCERISKERGITDSIEIYDNWQEVISYELDDEYVIHNNKVYEVLEQNDVGIDRDIFDASENEDGTISYEVMYYNGGCSFDKAIGHALDELRKED